MNWHLTLKDNETGETLIDRDICALIAGIGLEDNAQAVAMANCTGMDLVKTVVCAEEALQSALNENPIAGTIAASVMASRNKNKTEDPTEDPTENEDQPKNIYENE